jgi:hypothetical protein
VNSLLVSPSAKVTVPVWATNSPSPTGRRPAPAAFQSTLAVPVELPLRSMRKVKAVVPLLPSRWDADTADTVGVVVVDDGADHVVAGDVGVGALAGELDGEVLIAFVQAVAGHVDQDGLGGFAGAKVTLPEGSTPPAKSAATALPATRSS